MDEELNEVMNVIELDAINGATSYESAGLAFNYVNVVGLGCEGWLNLFFGDEIIALINNVALANQIRKQIPERKPNAIVRPFEDWIADKEAEYRMRGLGKKEAKEKAMEDWYLYQEPRSQRPKPNAQRPPHPSRRNRA